MIIYEITHFYFQTSQSCMFMGCVDTTVTDLLHLIYYFFALEWFCDSIFEQVHVKMNRRALGIH